MKEMPNATDEALLEEYYKFRRKYQEVDQQAQAIHSYLWNIQMELDTRNRKRMDNNEKCLNYEPIW